MAKDIKTIGIVGTGAMGAGIAQIAAQVGLDVLLFDARENAAQSAKDKIQKTLARLVEKGKMEESVVQKILSHLHVINSMEELAPSDLVVEAIIEKLEAKQGIVKQLEEIVSEDAILTSNTSSLSISAIAAVAKHPGRIAGYHFFNPVPLMKLVEVVKGVLTEDAVCQQLVALAKRMGHFGVLAVDSPGFIVNHASVHYTTESLQILSEGVTSYQDIDRVTKAGAGYRMGPFELTDLVGLDIAHTAIKIIYEGFFHDPFYRLSPLTTKMLAAGLLGMKTGQGFYRYDHGRKVEEIQAQPVPSVTNFPPIWVGAEDDEDKQQLVELLQKRGATIEQGEDPSEEAICLLAPWGYDALSASQFFDVDPQRVVCIDLIADLSKQRTLMVTPVTDIQVKNAVHALLAEDGVDVTVINDSPGFILQRILATMVNLGCRIAQQQIATPEDIDIGVKLGLNYPYGPLEWGEKIGVEKICTILDRLYEQTGDPRYRVVLWLRRRAELNLSLH